MQKVHIMIKLILIYLTIIAMPTHADDLDCNNIEGVAESWLDILAVQIDESVEMVRMSDLIWESVSDTLFDYILTYANSCIDEDVDYTYHGQFDIKNDNSIFGYKVNITISSIDVNLDDVDEWLIKFHVGDFWHGQGFLAMLYQPEDLWEIKNIWDRDTLDETLSDVSPTGVYVYEQADVLGYTYMGVALNPMSGFDPYVGGLQVLRWKNWEYEEVLLIPDICDSGWGINEDGMLFISKTSSIPQQGCTLNHLSPQNGIVIPDAQMILTKQS